ncbi:MAG: ImmA/IrrE family metallo-endopeptidase [Nanoarchaeota archaeon]|nr:ImmA/IrrE family metallo-endopeptidase [Nanoarchaeota archaeon]
MIIYKGYYHFRKGNGSIAACSCEGVNGYRNANLMIVFMQPRKYYIGVNNKDSLEEQVKSVLHEFAHIGLEHPFIKLDSETPEMNARAEDEAIRFYNKNSPLVGRIREILVDKKC